MEVDPADAVVELVLPLLAVVPTAEAPTEMFVPSSPEVTVCEAVQVAVAPGASGSGVHPVTAVALVYVGVRPVRVTVPTLVTSRV